MSDFDFFFAGGFDLIPINHWNAVDQDGDPRGKTPVHERWLVREHTHTELRAWIASGGNLGVRLRPTDLVIDIDTKSEHAPAGVSADAIAGMIELEYGLDLSNAPRVRTGSGGLHIYLSKPGDFRTRQRAGPFSKYVEFKSRGTQVLAGGSRHPSGNYYRLERAGAPVAAGSTFLEAIRREVAEGTTGHAASISIRHLGLILDELDPTEFREYDKWRNLCFSVHHATGGSDVARDVWMAWCATDPKYAGDGDKVEMIWDHAASSRVDARTGRTLFMHAVEKSGGVPPPPADEDFEPIPVGPEERPLPEFKRIKGFIKPTAENVRLALEHYGLILRYNDFDSKLLFEDTRRELSSIPFLPEEVGDNAVTTLASFLRRKLELRWQKEPSRTTVDEVCLAMGLEQAFHPVREWLATLTWDGVERLDTWLIGASDLEDSPYSRAVSRLFLYAAVGRIMVPGVKYDTTIILEGPQGSNKSSLISHLGGKWTVEGIPSLKSAAYKDVVHAMLGGWLVELPELASLSKTDVNALKEFLSKTVDRVRLSYDKRARDFPRHCVFIGTTNNSQYLTDTTGNRRFLPLKVGYIRLADVPREQLWAEAVIAWRSNPSHVIVPPQWLWSEAANQQELRRIQDPWEDVLEAALAKVSEISTYALLNDVLHTTSSHTDTPLLQRLARVMQRLGWSRAMINTGDGDRVRGYRRDVSE